MSGRELSRQSGEPSLVRESGGHPLHIVHIVRQFAPSVGGLEAVVESLGSEQVRSGHRVRVVTLDRLFHRRDLRLPTRENNRGMEVIRIPFIGSRRYPIAPGALTHVSKADIVHVHAVDFFFDFFAAMKPLHRKKLVLSTHGGFFHTDFAATLKKIYFSTITRASMMAYDYVAASSLSDERAFRTVSNRVGLVENGVDICKFRDAAASAPRLSLIYFGRIAPNKNIAALFPFLHALQKQTEQDWQLTIAGGVQGVTFDELRAAANATGVGDAVRFFDSPTDADLKRLISESSIFVSASAYEGFGIAAVEALSAGLLPVLSGIDAHRRTIEKAGEGVLVDFTQPAEAAASVRTAWETWCARGPAARAAAISAAQDYNWPNVARRFEEAYRRVLA